MTAVGCGGDEPVETLECGEHTVLQNGSCVLAERDCPDDQVVSPMGVCVEPDEYCFDDGTSYDAELGECIADDQIECGDGTVEQDGTCIADGPTQCGPGTVLADGVCQLEESFCADGTGFDDGQCVANEEACIQGAQFDVSAGACVFLDIVDCGEDTVESDGLCIPLRTFADELAEDADIDFTDDEPIAVSEDHDPFIFTGTMEDSLTHTFDMEGDEGQWLEITVYSRGLPSPGFRLQNVFDDWTRAAVPGMSSEPSRTVVLPRDGNYELTVTTSISDDEGFSSGDEDWSYVGTVEILEAPDPIEWAFEDENLIGDLTNTKQNFVELDVENAGELLFTPRELGADAESTTIEIWDTPTNFGSRHELNVGERASIDAGGDDVIYIHTDSVRFFGADTGYELEAQGAVELEPGEIHEDVVYAEAGDVIVVSHRSDQAEAVTLRVFDEDGGFHRLYPEVLARNTTSFDTDESMREYFPVYEDGEYTLAFQNVVDETITNFISQSSIGDQPTYDLNPPDSVEFDEILYGEDLLQGDWRIIDVHATTAAVVEGSAMPDDSSSWPPDVAVYDADTGEELGRDDGSYGSPTHFEFALPRAGRYFIAAQPTRSWASSAISDIHVEMEGRSVDIVEPGETKVFSYDGDTNRVLSGDITYIDGPAPDLRLVNPHGVTIFERPELSSGADLLELFPGPGEFDLEVHNGGDEPLVGLDVDAHITVPYDEVDVDQDFVRNYDRPALDEQQKDFLLFRPGTDTQFSFSAIYDDDEEAVVQIWDAETREILLKQDSDRRIDFEDVGVTSGVYAIEFRPLTDVGEFDVVFSGNDIEFVDEIRTHDPPLQIETNGGYETSALSVDQCAQIEKVSISVDMPSAANSSTNVYLYPPGGADSITLRDGSWGSHTTVYPDETTPDESLDPLIGTNGGGVWSLDVENESSTTTAELAAWGVHLRCLK